MGLSLNSQKSVMPNAHDKFHFVVSESCDRCVVHPQPQHANADIAFLIFYFCNKFKFTNSNEKCTTTTSLHSQSHDEEPQK